MGHLPCARLEVLYWALGDHANELYYPKTKPLYHMFYIYVVFISWYIYIITFISQAVLPINSYLRVQLLLWLTQYFTVCVHAGVYDCRSLPCKKTFFGFGWPGACYVTKLALCFCSCLLSTGITGMCQHSQVTIWLSWYDIKLCISCYKKQALLVLPSMSSRPGAWQHSDLIKPFVLTTGDLSNPSLCSSFWHSSRHPGCNG